MSSPEFPQHARVKVCDLVRTERSSEEVLFAVKPDLQAATVIRTTQGDVERIGFPGTYSGPVEVLGRLSVDQIVEGFVEGNFPPAAAEDMKAMVRDELVDQQQYGAVEIENY